MGSSYRSDLRGGSLKSWEGRLNEAIGLVRGVRMELWETMGDESQFDNASSDGGLDEVLGIVIRLLIDELPIIKEGK